MKTINEIYGAYATDKLVTEMQELSDTAVKILTHRRNDIVYEKNGLHNPVLDDVVKALDFWIMINNQTKEYLK